MSLAPNDLVDWRRDCVLALIHVRVAPVSGFHRSIVASGRPILQGWYLETALRPAGTADGRQRAQTTDYRLPTTVFRSRLPAFVHPEILFGRGPNLVLDQFREGGGDAQDRLI